MNKEEVLELLKLLKSNYNNFINESNKKEMLETWATELSQYDNDDIVEELKKALSLPEFQMKPPTLYYITSKCKKKHDKIDWNELVVYCDNCGRPFNSFDEMYKHRERENSIEYIFRETKKWYNKELNNLDKRKLFEMSDQEFKIGYDKLLNYIYEHTNDDEEKRRISYIFNPPNLDEAKSFINKN